MPSPLTHAVRRLAPSLRLVSAVAVAAASLWIADDARAAARIAISQPTANTVSGSIAFSAGPVSGSSRVSQVVFSVDGGRRWSTRARPYRYRGSGRLDTRTLSNGTHTLAVKVVYVTRRSRVASKQIRVQNPVVAPP